MRYSRSGFLGQTGVLHGQEIMRRVDVPVLSGVDKQLDGEAQLHSVIRPVSKRGLCCLRLFGSHQWLPQ